MTPHELPFRFNRAFLALWVSQWLSQLGTSVSTLAYPLLVLDLTGSAGRAGTVASVLSATTFLLRLPAAGLVDRYSYRRLMLAADLVRAGALGSLATAIAAGDATLPHVLAVVVAEGALGVVFGPAEFTAVRLVVAAARRADAVGRMQSRTALAGLLGPAAGGALFAVHPALPFAADAVSYLLSWCLVWRTRLPLAPGGRPPRGAMCELVAGIRWLRSQRFLWAAAWWIAGQTAVFGSVGLALLVLARARGATSGQIGILCTLSATGAVVGAAATPALQRLWSPRATLRAAAWADTAATAALLPVRSPYLMGAIGAVAFFLVPASNAALFGLVATTVPDELAGRAQAAATQVTTLLAPIAPVAIGAIADARDASFGTATCALAFLALAIVASTPLLPECRTPPPAQRGGV
ncbi:MAG TPA: MFS transporter [Streptosporangiales bacterium]